MGVAPLLLISPASEIYKRAQNFGLVTLIFVVLGVRANCADVTKND